MSEASAQERVQQLEQQLQQQAQQLERLLQAAALALASLQECEVPERGHDFAPAYEGARARKARATQALRALLKDATPHERVARAAQVRPVVNSCPTSTVLSTSLPREPVAHKKVFDRHRSFARGLSSTAKA